ncbi:hypothetical protein CZ771_13705 [Actinomycetales bacterium JB111]|nr:hypothetical protein CZ771_13705 [Actinomycetales bacterium JB111]
MPPSARTCAMCPTAARPTCAIAAPRQPLEPPPHRGSDLIARSKKSDVVCDQRADEGLATRPAAMTLRYDKGRNDHVRQHTIAPHGCEGRSVVHRRARIACDHRHRRSGRPVP